MQAARERQNQLTRPQGSLGRLEEISIQLAGISGRERTRLSHPVIITMIGAAARRVPVVIDGFISGAAAMIACGLAPAAQQYLIAAHRSVEIGHRVMLEHLKLRPLFDLDLRLGEGTGAALGISLCQAACKILDEMATFGEAGVATKDGSA